MVSNCISVGIKRMNIDLVWLNVELSCQCIPGTLTKQSKVLSRGLVLKVGAHLFWCATSWVCICFLGTRQLRELAGPGLALRSKILSLSGTGSNFYLLTTNASLAKPKKKSTLASIGRKR